jgi:hypothetical protein
VEDRKEKRAQQSDLAVELVAAVVVGAPPLLVLAPVLDEHEAQVE